MTEAPISPLRRRMIEGMQNRPPISIRIDTS
jgi:hypothetical protein